ncbi:hypothetical protein AGMMS49942_20990 [Spirochaetia bacterium]|nr:hypothetical protein AGMMS49942_20990 [Spirochaetia bacterium]
MPLLMRFPSWGSTDERGKDWGGAALSAAGAAGRLSRSYRRFNQGIPFPAFRAAAQPLWFLVAAAGTPKNKPLLFSH